MKKAALREVEEIAWRSGMAGRETISVTATQARKEFGRILDRVVQGRLVVITRHGAPHAVMMSVDRFDADRDPDADTAMLETLTAEFDAMLDRMQTPEARAAMDRAFNASPEELGRAAAKAARRGAP
jgi:prevent-host-death family protein